MHDIFTLPFMYQFYISKKSYFILYNLRLQSHSHEKLLMLLQMCFLGEMFLGNDQ